MVSICSPPFTHASIAIDSMERGSNVLTEKPMAMSVDEAVEMVRASERTGTLLCVNHNFLFSRSLMQVKRLKAAGSLGDTISVQALQTTNLRRRLPKWYPALPGGLFFDESPHMLYLLRFFLGGLKLEQALLDRTPKGSQPISSVEADFSGPSKAAGHLTMLFNAPRDEWRLTVVTAEKVLYLDVFRDTLIVMPRGGDHSPKEVLSSSLSYIRQDAKGVLGSGTRWTNHSLLFGQDTLVSAFVDSLLSKTPAPVSPQEGLDVVKAMNQILTEGGDR